MNAQGGHYLIKADKGFRRLKVHKQSPILRAAHFTPQQRLVGERVAPVFKAA